MRYVEDHWDYDGHNRIVAIAFGLSPIWLTLVFFFAGPTSFGEGLSPPTEAQLLAARTAEFALFALVGVLMLAGTVVLWRARSARVATAAILLLTLPALILLIMGPAFVLILENLTASSGH